MRGPAHPACIPASDGARRRRRAGVLVAWMALATAALALGAHAEATRASAAVAALVDAGRFREAEAVVDNLRFGNGTTCRAGTTSLADSDGDGLPDDWEEHGLDIDKNGTIDLDLPAMGATKDHKDVFVEVDHMVKDPPCVWLMCWGGRDFTPQQAALDDVRAAFAAAPVTNPDGSTGIRAHIDAGPGSVMTGTTTPPRPEAASAASGR